MRHRLEFYFDFISPFGYLASLRVDELAEQHQYECRWQSMLLGMRPVQRIRETPLKVFGISNRAYVAAPTQRAIEA